MMFTTPATASEPYCDTAPVFTISIRSDVVQRQRVQVEERIDAVREERERRNALSIHQHERVLLGKAAQSDTRSAWGKVGGLAFTPAIARVGRGRAQIIGDGRGTAFHDVFLRDRLDSVEADLVGTANQRPGHFEFLELLDAIAGWCRSVIVRGRCRGAPRCRRRRCRRRTFRCRCRGRTNGSRLALRKRRHGDCG